MEPESKGNHDRGTHLGAVSSGSRACSLQMQDLCLTIFALWFKQQTKHLTCKPHFLFCVYALVLPMTMESVLVGLFTRLPSRHH